MLEIGRRGSAGEYRHGAYALALGSATFLGGVLLAVALYGLTASGHFPGEARSEAQGWIRRPGATGHACHRGIGAASCCSRPGGSAAWHLAVIGGGAVALFAPLLLQPLPDSFVNGRRETHRLQHLPAAVLAGLMWLDASDLRGRRAQ